MPAYEVLVAAAAVLLSAYAALRSVRDPRPARRDAAAPVATVAATPAEPETAESVEAAEPLDAQPEPEPEPEEPRSTLETLAFSHETRARPLRRVSSAMALLVLTLLAAGGIATAIYRGLLAAWPG